MGGEISEFGPLQRKQAEKAGLAPGSHAPKAPVIANIARSRDPGGITADTHVMAAQAKHQPSQAARLGKMNHATTPTPTPTGSHNAI
jgi:hypothetical protein